MVGAAAPKDIKVERTKAAMVKVFIVVGEGKDCELVGLLGN